MIDWITSVLALIAFAFFITAVLIVSYKFLMVSVAIAIIAAGIEIFVAFKS